MADQPKVKAPWTLEGLRAKRDEIIALAEKNGTYNVRIFGSVARGDTHENSDVDILVSVHPKVSMFDLVGLWLDLQDFLECEVNLSTDEGMRKEWREAILKDAVEL